MNYENAKQVLENLSDDQLTKVISFMEDLNKDKSLSYSVQGYKLQLQRKNQRQIRIQ